MVRVLIYLYLFFCAWLIYAMPKLARGRLRFSQPQDIDASYACVLVYLSWSLGSTGTAPMCGA